MIQVSKKNGYINSVPSITSMFIIKILVLADVLSIIHLLVELLIHKCFRIIPCFILALVCSHRHKNEQTEGCDDHKREL